MPSLSGALGGAATGAKLGSAFGPWGTAIGGGIGAIAGLFTGGKSKLQKQMENKINPSLENLMHWSGQSRDKQNAMFDLAMPSMKNAGNFYNALLSSNSTAALQQILGPQMTSINDQYQGMLNSGAQFGPRGGGKNAAMADAGFARNRALMELVPKMKMQAAEGALKVGQAAGSQALDWGSMSTQQAGAVLQAVTGSPVLQGLQGRLNEKERGMGGVLAQLGELLPGLLDSIKRGKGGNSGGLDASFFTGD